MLDGIYGQGTAKRLIYNNLVGIFSLVEPKGDFNGDGGEMSSGLFVGKYGHELSVFATLYYFGSYIAEYKTTLVKFDFQDVLRQMGKVFLPWWRYQLGKKEDEALLMATESNTGKLIGEAALKSYLEREYVKCGRDVTESPLYGRRFLSEQSMDSLRQTTNQ